MRNHVCAFTPTHELTIPLPAGFVITEHVVMQGSSYNLYCFISKQSFTRQLRTKANLQNEGFAVTKQNKQLERSVEFPNALGHVPNQRVFHIFTTTLDHPHYDNKYVILCSKLAHEPREADNARTRYLLLLRVTTEEAGGNLDLKSPEMEIRASAQFTRTEQWEVAGSISGQSIMPIVCTFVVNNRFQWLISAEG
jgi:hypothetical protein